MQQPSRFHTASKGTNIPRPPGVIYRTSTSSNYSMISYGYRSWRACNARRSCTSRKVTIDTPRR
eukprot:scaffold241042_cov50-Prasinocladus_malaysianus.AAC.2